MSSTNKSAKKPIITVESIETFDDPGYWMGYKIRMSDHTKNIICKIENAHNCCEKWGIYTTSTLDDFIGAEYYSVYVSKIHKKDYEEMRMIVITITTNRGNITLHFYNEHNGYYSHDVFVESENGIKYIKL
jgi:hypothetical protein